MKGISKKQLREIKKTLDKIKKPEEQRALLNAAVNMRDNILKKQEEKENKEKEKKQGGIFKKWFKN